MSERKEAIRKLADSFVINGVDTLVGSWNIYFLRNDKTSDLCQIAECTNNDDNEIPMGLHKHRLSREIYYVVKGAITINGEKFETGQIKIIEPNTDHINIIHSNSACIVIIQPIEPAYPKGGSNGATVGKSDRE